MVKIEEYKLLAAREVHLDKLRVKVEPLITKQFAKHPFTDIGKFLLDNLDTLLTSKPTDLLRLHNAYKLLLIPPHTSEAIVKSKIKKVFNYPAFRKKENAYYSTYDLASNLDIRVCSYCNRQYTVTVDKRSRITRPQFDHFYPQVYYPLLALSFYNLIPSCAICNSNLKGKTDPSLVPIPHPYIDNIEAMAKYNYIPFDTAAGLGASSNLEIVIKPSPECDAQTEKMVKNADEVFKLSDIYTAHADEVQDLIRMRQLYGEEYLYTLGLATYTGFSGTSIEELYRLAFGTYAAPTDFHKRPMSKLKKDILQKLKMI